MTAPLVIVGAGPVGLALAVGLAQHDPQREIIVVEASSHLEFGESSRSFSLYISKRTFLHLGELGIVLDGGVTWENNGVYRNGKQLVGINIQAISRGSLVKELATHCIQSYSNIRIVFDHVVTGIDLASGFGASCRVNFKNHPSLDTEFVFDCSGCNSAIRGLAEKSGLQRYTPTLTSEYCVKILHFSGVPTGLLPFDPKFIHIIKNSNFSARIHRWTEPDKWVILVDLHGQRGRLYRDIDTFDAFADAVLLQLPLLVPYLVREKDLPRAVTTKEFWLDSYVWGQNVVFLGDAAHGTSPALGQGMNAGLNDVSVFLEEYKLHSGSIFTAAQSYSIRQVPQGKCLVLLSNVISNLSRGIPFHFITMSIANKLFPSTIHAFPSGRLHDDVDVTYAQVWKIWKDESKLVKNVLTIAALFILLLIISLTLVLCL